MTINELVEAVYTLVADAADMPPINSEGIPMQGALHDALDAARNLIEDNSFQCDRCARVGYGDPFRTNINSLDILCATCAGDALRGEVTRASDG